MRTRRNPLLAASRIDRVAAWTAAGAADDGVADFHFCQNASAMMFDKMTSKLTLAGIGTTTSFLSDGPEP